MLSYLQECPTFALVAGLFVLMVASNELGFRAGRRGCKRETELSRAVSNTLKGSIFGLVALLLGFSFSATTSRYDMRQRAVLDEANAINTCHLRAGLLDDGARDRLRDVLRRYVNARVEQGRVPDDDPAAPRLRLESEGLLEDLWSEVEGANRRTPDAVRNGHLVPAANAVIDLGSKRAWAYRNHLPIPVLLVLSLGVVLSCLLLGHSSGQADARHPGLWLAVSLLFATVLYIIIDFDRPRRGLIRVDQTPLIELRDTIGKVVTPLEEYSLASSRSRYDVGK